MALQKMEESGELKAFLEGADPKTRHAFLQTLASNGYLQQLPEVRVKGGCNPPGVPGTFYSSASLPKSIRDAINADCVQARASYRKAYEDYEQRYVAAAQSASTIAQLRALGPPIPPGQVQTPGLVYGPPDFQEKDAAFRKTSPATATMKPANALQDRICELTGEPRAGSYHFKLTAEVDVLGLKLGGWMKQAQHHQGIEWGHEESGRIGPASVGLENGHVPVGRFDGSPGDDLSYIKANGEGMVEVALPIGPLSPVVMVDPEHAVMEAGLGQKFELGHHVEVEFSARVGATGITGEQAMEAIRSPGFFNAPERAEGVRWNELSPARRAEYEKMHWTAEEWNR
jgi:hypothetical protein